MLTGRDSICDSYHHILRNSLAFAQQINLLQAYKNIPVIKETKQEFD